MATESREGFKLRNPYLRDHGVGVRPRFESGSAIRVDRRSVEDPSDQTQEAENSPFQIHRRRSRQSRGFLRGSRRDGRPPTAIWLSWRGRTIPCLRRWTNEYPPRSLFLANLTSCISGHSTRVACILVPKFTLLGRAEVWPLPLPLIGGYVGSHRNRLPAHMHFHTHLEQARLFGRWQQKQPIPFKSRNAELHTINDSA